MRKKIDQLLNGKFEYQEKPPVISAQRIDQTGSTLSPLMGSFTISSADEKKIRGFLYSSNPRVSFEPAQFFARDVRITYQADLTGLEEGQEANGAFTLCTDAGEFSLPYRFVPEIRRSGGAETPEEQVPTLEELADLASTDIYKARSVFVSAPFASKLKKMNSAAYLFWENLHDTTLPDNGLEEFLIACHKKESVDISVSESYISLDAPDSAMRRSLELSAGCQGYLELTVTSDSRFIRMERKNVTTDEFVAGKYTLYYIIDTNFLHAGMNYGRISISTCYQTILIDVAVRRGAVHDAASASRVRRLMRKKMLELYIDLRLRRIEMQSWIDRSMNVITGYKRAGGDDLFADLLQAQLYYADGKKSRGRKIISDIEKQTHRFETAEQYAFFLYISTFFEQDAAYVDQVEARVEQLFLQRRSSWIIQWILLYLNERYLKDDGAKLEAILQQVQLGCCSPIMYLEACQIYSGNPYLLRNLDNTSCRLMLFAAKYGLIGDELAFHIANLTVQAPAWSGKLFRILTACYERTHSKEVLGAICACLIAGDKKDKQYFEWYSAGVEEDVRITGLYEYYMETMDQTSIEKMPQIIRMYFSYNNTLGYHRKAAIYRSISDNAVTVPQVYRSNRQNIEHFVISSLSMGRIDENLAVLYERFLTKRMLTKPGAEQLARLLFAYEITCKNPNMVSVAVIHKNVRAPQEVMLRNGKARGYIYSDDACVLLVDRDGRRYASSSLMQVRRYLDSALLLEWCRELVPRHPSLEMYTVCKGEPVTENTLDCYMRAQAGDDFKKEFRQQIRKNLLAWYLDHPGHEATYAFLHGADRDDFVMAGKAGFVSLLTREGMYEEAFDILEKYGIEDVDPSVLVRICSQSVLIREFDEQPLLTSYCMHCYRSGKYDDNILTYLLMYYDGPIEEMKRLWNTGHQNEMDTMILEEKILSLIIFTGTGSEGTEHIFASYQSMLGRRKLCQAYLNLKAYEYFVRNLPVADIIFDHLEQMYVNGEEMEDVARLALLQHYSGKGELSEEQRESVTEMIMDYNARGMRFAFFKNFPEELTKICQLEDKVFLEYVTNPLHTVKLFYRMKDEKDFVSEPMRNCFGGIFVREFILFEENEAECYTEEYSDGKMVSRSATRSLSGSRRPDDTRSRYGQLCRMSALAAEGKTQELAEAIESYEMTDYLTAELFGV